MDVLNVERVRQTAEALNSARSALYADARQLVSEAEQLKEEAARMRSEHYTTARLSQALNALARPVGPGGGAHHLEVLGNIKEELCSGPVRSLVPSVVAAVEQLLEGYEPPAAELLEADRAHEVVQLEKRQAAVDAAKPAVRTWFQGHSGGMYTRNQLAYHMYGKEPPPRGHYGAVSQLAEDGFLTHFSGSFSLARPNVEVLA